MGHPAPCLGASMLPRVLAAAEKPGLSGAEQGWVTRGRARLTPAVHIIDCDPEEVVETLVTCFHVMEMLNTHPMGP